MKSGSLYLFAIALIFAACKKNNSNSTPATVSSNPTSNFSLDYQNAYGNCYQYTIGKDPLTLYPDGSYLVSSVSYDGATDVVQLNKVNASGVNVWTKKYKFGSYWHKSGNPLLTSDGNILLIGTAPTGSSWTERKTLMVKLDQNGDTIWHRIYGYNYDDLGVGAVEDTGNNYWVIDFSAQQAKCTFIKINNNGDSLTSVSNTESYSVQYVDHINTSANEIVVAGTSSNFVSTKQPVYIAKYLNGIKIFSNNFVLTNYDEVMVTGVSESYDGNYLVFGRAHNFSTTPYHGFILKIDKNGNLISETINSVTNDVYFTWVQEYSAGNYFVGVQGNGFNPGLYKWSGTLSQLTTFNYPFWSFAQMVIKGNKLYTASHGTDASSYETVTVHRFSF